jgi:hypothetical protein
MITGIGTPNSQSRIPRPMFRLLRIPQSKEEREAGRWVPASEGEKLFYQ